MSSPKVSVIIPCYNQGQYVDEAVDSVLAQTFQDFEIIIINDGSTDELTNKKLSDYHKPKTKVFTIENRGLPDARNYGIKKSTGKYILPLDADDKISKEYLAEAIEILEEFPNIGIVYSRAEFFGNKTGEWFLTDYTFKDILSYNMIFCSGIYRKEDYDKTTGYNPNMKYGWEDWDFWLSLIELGLDVHKIDKVHFFYRVTDNSMSQSIKEEYQRYLRKKIVENHIKLYLDHFESPVNLYYDLLKCHRQNESILNSKDYTLGNKILKPLRKIKSRFR